VNAGLRDVFERDLPPELMLNNRSQIGKRVSVIVVRPENLLEIAAEKL